jgi:hypothetical protein
VVGLAAAACSAGEGLGRRWCGRWSGGSGVGAGEGGASESGRWVAMASWIPPAATATARTPQGASSAARATGSADAVGHDLALQFLPCLAAPRRRAATVPRARSPAPSREHAEGLPHRLDLVSGRSSHGRHLLTRRRSNYTCVVWEVLPDLGARTRRRSPLVARGGDQAMALPVVDLPSPPVRCGATRGPGCCSPDQGGGPLAVVELGR